MGKLTITLIDVGWGDSILIESEEATGETHRGLIDSNDTAITRSSSIFLKKHFEKEGLTIEDNKPFFDFVILSHAHADHAQGLKSIMREFGTKFFWYPKSLEWASFTYLISFARRSKNIDSHQAIDSTNILPSLGSTSLKVLWPPKDLKQSISENNNSIVLSLTLGDVSVLLTGDAEALVWNQIAGQIPNETAFFKVPHHGSVNGTFDNGQPIWINNCPNLATLGISSHVRPFSHPDPRVIDLFNKHSRSYLRTDEHFHIIFSTDGVTTSLRYSHLE